MRATTLHDVHNAALERPLKEIAIEFTVYCNLSCEMCSVWTGKRHGISAELARETLRQARFLGADVLTPCGAESFMRRDILDLFTFAERLGFTKISVVTNGLLLTPAKLDRLESLRTVHLSVSIDGPQEIHDSLRGPGTFDRVTQVLSQLRARGIPFSVSTVLMPRTIGHVERLLESVASFGVEEVSMQPFQPEMAYGRENKEQFEFSSAARDEIRSRILDIADFANGLGISIYTEDLLRYVPDYLAYGTRPIPEGGCFLPSRFLLVDVNGNVYPCFFMREQAIGNVHDTALKDLWHNETQRMLNRMALSEQCPGCLAACSDISTHALLARNAESG